MGESNPVVSIAGSKVVADSRDVAKFFRKQHRDVLRAIDNLIVLRPDLTPAHFCAGVYTRPDTGQQEHRRFEMDRDGFTVLAMGFTGAAAVDFKLKYIAAFNRMEADLRNVAPPSLDVVLNDPVALRGLLLTHTERRIEAERKVAELTPKAVAFDRIANADGVVGLREAAKVLGQPPKAFMDSLVDLGWLYRQPGSNRLSAYRSTIKRGLADHKTFLQVVEGEDRLRPSPVITAKGMAVLAERYAASAQLGLPLPPGTTKRSGGGA